MSETRGFPRGEAFADDDNFDTWDQDRGMPTTMYAANALQVWAVLQNRQNVSVREAGDAFNLDDAQIRELVDAHPWMFLLGSDDDPSKQTIEHDGE